jgi:glycosyltransferase involved in cell wall biosynthesis
VALPRIFVVSELYYPETASTAKFLTSFAEGLAEEFEVVVICGQPNYDVRGTAPKEEDHNGTHIIRCRGTRFNKNKLAGRVLNALTITWSMALTGRKIIRPGDAILAVTNPPTMPPQFLRLAKSRGAKFVLLVHDVYPEAMIASGLTAPDSKLAQQSRAKSEILMRGADAIVAIGRCMKELVLNRLENDDREKVVVIPNYAETEDLKPEAEGENSVIRELGLQGKFVVQLAGNIGRTHGVEAMLDAAEALKDENVHFLIVGSGARRPWLEQQVAQRSLANVTIHDFFPRERLGDALRAGDVQLISFVPGMYGVSVPSRMYNVLAAGVPLIASADPGTELCLLIEEENLGWSTPAGDGKALAAAIREAKSNPETLKEMGSRARAVAERDYSEAAVREQWKSLFRRLFQS